MALYQKQSKPQQQLVLKTNQRSSSTLNKKVCVTEMDSRSKFVLTRHLNTSMGIPIKITNKQKVVVTCDNRTPKPDR